MIERDLALVKLGLENMPAEMQAFIARLPHSGSAEDFMRERFKGDLSNAQLHELKDVKSGVPGVLITQRTDWREYSQEMTRIISTVIAKSICDISEFAVYDAKPMILIQLFDGISGIPIEHKYVLKSWLRRGAAVSVGNIRRPRLNAADLLIVDKTQERSIRPRWAEENRPKKQVKLRLQPELIQDVDEAADQEGLTRNDWIELAIKNQLAQKPQ
ncbi:MAG TPA: hypothetical protein PKD55_23385 [Bellilinea sp.]|nr:hypothetical protein [Bellilinea sp.]